jgi:hypothetical protein
MNNLEKIGPGCGIKTHGSSTVKDYEGYKIERMRVEGGWIYMWSKYRKKKKRLDHLIFVPDPLVNKVRRKNV